MFVHYGPMAAMNRKSEIDRLTRADSVITLLGRLNVERFPPVERMAVARLQVEAIDDWLAAYLENVTRTDGDGAEAGAVVRAH